jgi:hypothetical protein
MNAKPPANPGSRWALPVALLVLAAYFVLGVASGGAERGWWS